MTTDVPTFDDIGFRIEQMVTMANISYIDAAVHFSETQGIEIEYLGELIAQNPVLMSRIESEAESLHCIKKIDRLPLD